MGCMSACFFCLRPFSIYFSHILLIETRTECALCLYEIQVGIFFRNLLYNVIIHRNSTSICVCGKFGCFSARVSKNRADYIERLDRCLVFAGQSLEKRFAQTTECVPRKNDKSSPCILYCLLCIIHAQFLLVACRDFRP